jgi:hypothetical protein
MAGGTPFLQNAAARADRVGIVPVVTWIAIGAATMLALSVLVGLAVAAILGRISREISELHEMEPWAVAPPTRAKVLAP